MPNLLAALLLGIIEGITEFLPISSTGHLLIAERWLGARSELFNIAIQAGAIVAVVLIYRVRLWTMLLAFLGRGTAAAGAAAAGVATTDATATPALARGYAWKLIAAFVTTAVLGLGVKALGWELPDQVRPVAWALVLGALWMLAAEYFAARRAAREGERTAVSWTVAILVGIAQVVAGVFPGTSRSATTIFIALLAGTTSRVAATEFAFLVGIPTMFAATGYELLSLVRHGQIGHEDWAALGVAFVAALATAFVAVKWLLHYIQSHRFTPFAFYRIALGVALLWWLPAGS